MDDRGRRIRALEWVVRGLAAGCGFLLAYLVGLAGGCGRLASLVGVEVLPVAGCVGLAVAAIAGAFLAATR